MKTKFTTLSPTGFAATFFCGAAFTMGLDAFAAGNSGGIAPMLVGMVLAFIVRCDARVRIGDGTFYFPNRGLGIFFVQRESSDA